MKKIILLFSATLLISFMGFSQEDTIKYWKINGINQLNLNQVSLTNWSAGGLSSVSFGLVFKWYANYHKGNWTWDNNLNMLYGQYKEQGERLKKNDDLFDLTSIAGYRISDHWDGGVLFNFNTQFAKGYDKDYDTVKISNFMSPGSITISPSVQYKPKDWFRLVLSPATAKFTFVTDQELADLGAFGVTPAVIDTATGAILEDGENIRWRVGAYAQAWAGKSFSNGLSLESKLTLYYAYNDRGNLNALDMDVEWQNFANYKLKDWLSMSLFLHLLYLPGQAPIEITMVDGEVKPKAGTSDKVQFKEVLGIGLTYNFNNTK